MAGKNDATLQNTKQMLDELDALMEKMLALPVNDLEDNVPAFPQEVVKKSPTLTPTLSATLTLLEGPAKPLPAAPEEPAISHPVVNPPHLALAPAKLTPAAPPRVPAAPPRVPAPPPPPLSNELAPPSVLPKLEPLLEEIPEPAVPVTTRWGYLPLVWINQAFDRSTLVLGGAGERLRSQGGRLMLGMSGIALMLVAGVWFLKDWLGWNWPS